MSTYSLKHFHARGAAEISRLLFAVAGVEYQDVRYSPEEWATHKEEMPLKALPVLAIDGVQYSQSHAIERYLARKFDLYGSTELEGLKIDEVQEAFNDLLQSVAKIFFAQTEEEKEKLSKPLKEDAIPKFMAFFERRLCENNGGDGFMVGSGLTLADIAFFNNVFGINSFLSKNKAEGETEDFTAKFPKLSAYYNRIGAEPKIAAWVKKRPKTEL